MCMQCAMCLVKHNYVCTNSWKTPVHGKYLAGENFCRQKLLMRKIQRISNSQCICICIYVFHVSANIGEEYFGKWLTICQIHQFSPTKIFPCMVCASIQIYMHTTDSLVRTYMYIINAHTIHRKILVGENWQILQIVSHSPKFASPIFTDTRKTHMAYTYTDFCQFFFVKI